MSEGGAPRELVSAVALLAEGETRSALHAASEACHAAPQRPDAHYVYGQAWLALNEPARAEQAFAAALQRAPAWADAWVSYGVARYRQGALDDAQTAMRQALHHEPRHFAATANLGAFLRITGHAASAEALLRATLEHDPGNTGARLNLAADMLLEERGAEALALLDDAAAPALQDDPRAGWHWQLQRTLALLQLGRAPEARAVLAALEAHGPPPPALAPLWHWRHVLLARQEGRSADADAAAEAMAKALDAMGPDAVPEHRIMAHHDLAKFRSAIGEHRAAFAHWQTAHRLLAPTQPFSRERHRAVVEAMAAAFDRTRFAAGPRAGNGDTAPVFIVGMPRSGTTLCEQILAAHGAVHGAGERLALGELAERLGGGCHDPAAPARIAALDRTALDRAARPYLAELHDLAPSAARVVDKMPGNALHLGLVGLVLPGAKIIHCVRDPRDIGLSIFTFRFHGDHGYAHDLADLGWTIAQHVRLMDHWKAVLPNPILTLPLQDWVEDFDGTLARVLAHLDLPPDAACARFHERERRVRTVSRAQVRQPVNARGLGRWKTYAEELAPMIAEFDRAGLLPPSR